MGNRNIQRIWCGVAPAMLMPLIASLFYFVWFREPAFVRFAYVGIKIFTLAWPAMAVLWILRETLPRWQLKDSLHWKALPAGMGMGFLIAILLFALMRTPAGEMIRESTDRISDKAITLGITNYYWGFSIFISVFHSLIEEYYWRWFVYGQLTRVLPAGWAHILAGLSFSAHHIVIATQYFPNSYGIMFGLLVGVGGVFWSLLYAKHKTLYGVWISHMIVDLSIMVIGYDLICSRAILALPTLVA